MSPPAAGNTTGRAAPLERSLDLLIERLTIAQQTPRVRALRIEALRLRSIMANWRSIPPLPEVRDAMLARVLHVCSAAGDIPMDAPDPQPAPPVQILEPVPPDEYDDDEDSEDYDEPPPSDLEPTADGVHVLPPEEPESEPPSPPPPPVITALAAPGQFRHKAPHNGFPVDAFDEPPWARRRGRHPPHKPGWREVPYVSAYPELPAPPPTTVEVHIERFPDDLDARLVMIRDPTGVQADAFRSLRQRLVKTGDPKTIAVSSAGEGEGKTTTAANLALAYREIVRGGRVLLLEANVRRPGLSKIFGFDPPDCFGDQLNRHKDGSREPWVAVEQIAPLHVMAVDPRLERSPLLDPIAFGEAMKQLKQAGYDYIVVDTPPILEGADVNLITETVEGLLFATRAAKTKQKALSDALERLGPATVFGAVMLDAQQQPIG